MQVKFTRHKVGDRQLSARNENLVQEVLESLTNASNTNAFIGPTGQHHRQVGKGGRSIFRYIVTTTDAAPDVALVKRYDGTNESGTEIPVRVFWMPELDEELYAFKPVGGTDAVYNGAPVVWLEMYQLRRAQYDGMTVTTEGGQAVWEFQKAVALPGV